MANKAKHDTASEAALNAVEEALAVDFAEELNSIDDLEAKIDSAASKFKNATEDSSESETDNLSLSDELPGTDLSEFDDINAKAPSAPPSAPPAAANDEVNPELANLIYAIQQKPKSRVFAYTAVLTIIWLVACAIYAYQNVLPTLPLDFKPIDAISSTRLLTFIAIAILPLLPLWAFAILVRRSQEMRHAANAMTEAAIQLLQPETATTNSVATVGNAIRREVNALGDGVERAIARAGELEFMVQKEVMNLERSYGDSEVRLRRLVSEIGTERETMVDHADKLKLAISDTHTNLTSDVEVVSAKIEEHLRNATMAMSDTLVMRSNTITTSLTDTSEGLVQLLSSTGDKINQQLSATKNELTKNVNESAASMATTINTNGKAMAQLIETRTAGLQQATAIIDKRLADGKNEFDSAFAKRTEELSSVMLAANQSVGNLLKSTTAEIAEQGNTTIKKIEEGRTLFRKEMSEQAVELAGTFNSGNQKLKNVLDASVNSLVEKQTNTLAALEKSKTAFDETIHARTNEFSDTISAKTNEFDKIVTSKANVINETIHARTSEIAQTLANANDDVNAQLEISSEKFEKRGEEIAQQVSDNMSIRASEFASQISEAGEKIETSLNSQVSAINTSISTQGEKLAGTLGMRTEALSKVLAERTEAIGQTIGQRLSGFGQQLTSQVDDTVDKLHSQVNSLQENTKNVEEIIVSKTKQVEDAVKSSTINFATTAEENIKATAAKTAQINKALNQTTEQVSSRLNETSNEINAKLNETSEKLDIDLKTAKEEIVGTIETNKNDFADTMSKTKSDFINAIEIQKDVFTTSIEGSTDVFSKAVEERSNNLSSKLSQGAHHIATSLDEKSKAATKHMEESVKALEERLSDNANTVENQFSAGNQILEENLARGKEELLTAISKTLNDAGSALDGKAEKIASILTQRADLINENLGSSLVDTQRTLEAKTEELNALLSGRTSELANLIDSEAKPIVTSIIEAGTKTSAKLGNLSKLLGEEANELFTNIGTSSELLNKLIKNASGNLDTMQSTLNEQIESFSTAVKATTENVANSKSIALGLTENMRKTSDEMNQNINIVSQRIEAQGIILNDATKIIDAAQSNLEVTLESKQEALQQLAVGLVSHTDRVNNDMNAFNQMISSMVQDASTRSQNISGDMAKEISKAIEDATSRFDDAVSAMRSAAHTMRSELEETREQMRRGILELPDETEKNASAMRRVVTDQIAALRDLSAIVENSGKVFDTAPQMSTPMPSQTNRTVATPQPEPITLRQPVSPNVGSPNIDMTLRGSQTAIAPQPTMASQPAPRAPSQPTKNAGWVSDLLRRASEEETTKPAINVADNRSPNQVVDSLNSLSVDIANAIDHATSIELWDRYQRGETNVFTRRLYTLKGQKTFDEIRNKFARDPDFKMAVNRYIADFEQLLGRETQNGLNQALTQSYLTSDTGKVYTMLAHASGRLGSQV